MQAIHDRVPLCRCFTEIQPALHHNPQLAKDAGEPIGRDAEPSLALRPDVPCLQRWMDLNA